MDINEFITILTEVFEDTDPSLLTPDCYFKELEEYGSLTTLSLIAAVDENYDIPLKGVEIRIADTIEDLFKIIADKKNK